MAYAVDSSGPVRLTDNLESAGAERTVRNDGPGTVVIARDPQLAPTHADAFSLASSTEQTVWLAEGEALYAICPSGQTASVDVI